VFGAETVERLRFISSCRTNGMGLGEIAGLLDLLQEPGEKCTKAKDILQGAIGNITARISVLQSARETLSRAASACNDTACKALPEGCNIATSLG
jgi:DNA-binding transcriptional MerR regulator